MGMLITGQGNAQDASPPPSLLSRLKSVLSGTKIAKSATDIYVGGVQYGAAVTNPNRNEQQTRDGVAGGLKAVSGGAALASTIGGAGAVGAKAMTVPVEAGGIVLPDYVTQANKVERVLELLDRGDTATLEREDVEGKVHARQTFEKYRTTLNHSITSPDEFSLGALLDKTIGAVFQRQAEPNSTVQADIEPQADPATGSDKWKMTAISSSSPGARQAEELNICEDYPGLSGDKWAEMIVGRYFASNENGKRCEITLRNDQDPVHKRYEATCSFITQNTCNQIYCSKDARTGTSTSNAYITKESLDLTREYQKVLTVNYGMATNTGDFHMRTVLERCSQ